MFVRRCVCTCIHACSSTAGGSCRFITATVGFVKADFVLFMCAALWSLRAETAATDQKKDDLKSAATIKEI